MLAGMGVGDVGLVMCASEDDELFELGVGLIIALLFPGNRDVALMMLDSLSDAASAEKLYPGEGSGSHFLHRIKYRLRLGFKEISERKLYLVLQVERRLVFSEATEGLSAAAVTAMRAELEKPFPSRAHVEKVVELLRLLCEGHNARWQDWLRFQPKATTSCDIIKEVLSLLQVLEPEVDTVNIGQVQKCVDALTHLPTYSTRL